MLDKIEILLMGYAESLKRERDELWDDQDDQDMYDRTVVELEKVREVLPWINEQLLKGEE